MLPRIVRSAVEICFGTSPSQAPTSQPLENTSPVTIAATIALEMIGPMPGTVISRRQPWSCRASSFNLAGKALDALVQPAPVSGQVLDHPQHARREHIAALRQDSWQLSAQKTQPLPYCDAALQQEGADLIDDAGALADQSLAHAVQRLQIELLGSLGCDELHRRALHRLGDRLRIAEVVLLPLRIRAHVLCRHQPSIVAEQLQLAAEMMRPDAGLHPDQARWIRSTIAPR
jgi:hypothetical protein